MTKIEIIEEPVNAPKTIVAYDDAFVAQPFTLTFWEEGKKRYGWQYKLEDFIRLRDAINILIEDHS